MPKRVFHLISQSRYTELSTLHDELMAELNTASRHGVISVTARHQSKRGKIQRRFFHHTVIQILSMRLTHSREGRVFGKTVCDFQGYIQTLVEERIVQKVFRFTRNRKERAHIFARLLEAVTTIFTAPARLSFTTR